MVRDVSRGSAEEKQTGKKVYQARHTDQEPGKITGTKVQSARFCALVPHKLAFMFLALKGNTKGGSGDFFL